jgi:hypothetical protein
MHFRDFQNNWQTNLRIHQSGILDYTLRILIFDTIYHKESTESLLIGRMRWDTSLPALRGWQRSRRSGRAEGSRRSESQRAPSEHILQKLVKTQFNNNSSAFALLLGMQIKKLIWIVALLAWAMSLEAAQPELKPSADSLLRRLNAGNSKDIGALAARINAVFRTEDEKLRAIFLWTATHLRYDLASARQNTQPKPLPEIIELAFKSRKAVCEGYAGIMDSLNRLCGIESVLISGYTRQSGKLDLTPHMWLATRTNGLWRLHDPTWGSGSVINNRYVAQLDEGFFKVLPEKMIATHMPYDPLWQLLKTPFTHKEFIYQLTAGGAQWNISDSITKWQSSNQQDRWRDELKRITAENFSHKATHTRIDYLGQSITIFEINRSIYQLKEITDQLNLAIEYYNQAVEIQNRAGRKAAVDEKLHQSGRLIEQLLNHIVVIPDFQQIRHEKIRLNEALRSHEKKVNQAFSQWK